MCTCTYVNLRDLDVPTMLLNMNTCHERVHDIIMYILFFIRTWQTNDHDSKKQTTLLYAIKHVIYNNGALASLFGAALVVKNTVMHKNPVTTATTPTHV